MAGDGRLLLLFDEEELRSEDSARFAADRFALINRCCF